jgi:hypothetical protein
MSFSGSGESSSDFLFRKYFSQGIAGTVGGRVQNCQFSGGSVGDPLSKCLSQAQASPPLVSFSGNIPTTLVVGFRAQTDVIVGRVMEKLVLRPRSSAHITCVIV